MEKRFIELFKETLEIEGIEINITDKFREFVQWDSMAALNIIAVIDEEYNIVIDAKRFRELITINDLIEEIKKHI